MADTERLLLQVDATVELLRRELAQAEPSLDRFERRADKMASAVDRSVGRMGERLSAFGREAETSAQRAQTSFEASFSQVQRLASTALKAPTVEGRIDLGVNGLRAQAAQIEQQASAYREIEAAARRAAAVESDASEATRLFISATAAARIEAERKATALLQEAGALERVQIELAQSAGAVDLFVTRHQKIGAAAAEAEQLALSTRQAAAAQQLLVTDAAAVRAAIDPMYAAQQRFDVEMDRAERLYRGSAISLREYQQAVQLARNTLQQHAVAVAGAGVAQGQLTGAQQRGLATTTANRMAMQGLSYQAQDTFTQMSMGANFFQVFAIQGAQAAGQVSNLEGRIGAVGRFFLGPWGLAITAATLVLGAATKNMDLFSDAADRAVDKLEQDAKQSEAAAIAQDRFAGSAAGVAKAIRDQTKALDENAKSRRASAEQANIDAKASLAREIGIRRETVARLEQAQAEAKIAGSTGSPQIVALYASREADLQTQADEQRKSIEEAERNVQRTRVDLATEAAKRAVDPIARINKLYDDRIAAAQRAADAEAKAGGVVTASLTRQITAYERQRKAALAAEQARQQAAKTSSTDNRQIGRDVDVAGATAIVASIGGRVTSGRRSTERQAEIYADKLAGRHNGPVARPGTSAHETGNAIDVAYGAGITVASIRKAFLDAGVKLRKVLDEPGQRVFHVEYGKAGPSRATVARQQETARQQVLDRDTAYTDQERAAREKLLAATRKSASSEEERDHLTRESIDAEAAAYDRKVVNQQAAGDIGFAEMMHLRAINEVTRQQRQQNVTVEAATRTLERRYSAEEDGLQGRLAQLRLDEDLTETEADRRQVAREILDLEQQIRRKALERVRDTSQDPGEVARAQAQLGRLPAIEAAENKGFERSNAGPLARYREQLQRESDDTTAALQNIAVRGFGSLEDAGSRATASAVTDLLHLRGVAGEVVGGVIADLARLAIQKAIVKAVGTGFLGFADGGLPADAPGFATGGSPGGKLQGPGTGRSDSILALLSGGKGAIRVSTGEYIINEQATREYLPLIEAINARRLPGFATGGLLRQPNVPSLRSPRLPDVGAIAARRDRFALTGRVEVEASPLLLAKVTETSARMVGAAAEPIMAETEGRVFRRANRLTLPGGWG